MPRLDGMGLPTKYKKFFDEKLSNLSHSYKKNFISLLHRLPPPDELTTEWVIEFIRRPGRTGGALSNDTICHDLLRIQMVSEYLGEDVTKGITRPKKRKLTRKDIPEEDVALHLVRNAPNEMTRAYIHIFTEMGPRADEGLSIQIEDMKLGKTNMRVMDAILANKRVSGRMWRVELTRSKTFTRPLWLYHSTPSILAWLKSHPVKSGPLFVTLRRVRVNGRLVHKELGYGQIRQYVVRAWVNSGFRDPDETRRLKCFIRFREQTDMGTPLDKIPKNNVERKLFKQFVANDYPLRDLQRALDEQMSRPPIPGGRPIHCLRHLVGTRFAGENMAEEKMNKALGWSDDSRSRKRYIHLIDSDIEDEMYRRAGLLDPKDEKKIDIEAWICPVCSNLNPATSSICLLCPPKPDVDEDRLEIIEKGMLAIVSMLDEDARKKLKELGIVMPVSLKD